LNFSQFDINLRYFTLQSQENSTIKVFNEVNENMKYVLRTNNQILINDKEYDITLKKDSMIIKNENIEIHYIKEQ